MVFFLLVSVRNVQIIKAVRVLESMITRVLDNSEIVASLAGDV